MSRAGHFRHRVQIQAATVTRDPLGGEVKTWAQVATRWAAVEPLTGREFLAAQQEGAQITTRIRLRYMPGLVPTMRVLHGTRTYDVQTVLDQDGRQRELHLMAVESVG